MVAEVFLSNFTVLTAMLQPDNPSDTGPIGKATDRKIKIDQTSDDFFCPITHQVMEDPVITSNGKTYERKAIENWFSKNSKCPLTLTHIEDKRLIPDLVLRQSIKKFGSGAKTAIHDTNQP